MPEGGAWGARARARACYAHACAHLHVQDPLVEEPLAVPIELKLLQGPPATVKVQMSMLGLGSSLNISRP